MASWDVAPSVCICGGLDGLGWWSGLLKECGQRHVSGPRKKPRSGETLRSRRWASRTFDRNAALRRNFSDREHAQSSQCEKGREDDPRAWGYL